MDILEGNPGRHLCCGMWAGSAATAHPLMQLATPAFFKLAQTPARVWATSCTGVGAGFGRPSYCMSSRSRVPRCNLSLYLSQIPCWRGPRCLEHSPAPDDRMMGCTASAAVMISGSSWAGQAVDPAVAFSLKDSALYPSLLNVKGQN